jgi:hypothetical protein
MVLTNKIQYIGAVLLVLLSQTLFAQRDEIQYFRYYDQRGVNVFETSKEDSVKFNGVKLRVGANFTQGYQNLSNSNKAKAVINGTDTKTNKAYKATETAYGSGEFKFSTVPPTDPQPTNPVVDPLIYGGYLGYVIEPSPSTAPQRAVLYTNANQVYEQTGGFPLAQANFNIDVQLADGVRVSLVSYMSAHHHNEFWVKGGYFQIDKVGFLNSELMNNIWKNLTLKVGHMEINYGDAHFRRSDGGNVLWNPFIENNIVDAFDTEIGGELYWQKSGIIAMVGLTDGEIQGSVTKPNDRSPSIYGKLGYDKAFSETFRARLTGSVYTTKSSISNNLYSGDRTGSNYQFVLENTAATVTGNFRSGRLTPGFSDNVTAIMINPFVKFHGLELFGTIEMMEGNTAVENGEVQYSDPIKAEASPAIEKQENRKFNQFAVDLLYRFGKQEQFYVGGRYNKADGTMVFGTSTSQGNINQGTRSDVSVERTALGAGWFITKNILLKGEYVTQKYNGWADDNILAGGKFDGIVIQGTIGF